MHALHIGMFLGRNHLIPFLFSSHIQKQINWGNRLSILAIFLQTRSHLLFVLSSLAIYMQCCFNTVQDTGGLLFPGGGQDARFSTILSKVILLKKREVEMMGYNVDDLGTHSIRKVAIS